MSIISIISGGEQYSKLEGVCVCVCVCVGGGGSHMRWVTFRKCANHNIRAYNAPCTGKF